jgi:hypothetical protein
MRGTYIVRMKTAAKLLRFLSSNPFSPTSPQLLTVETATDFVNAQKSQGIDWVVLTAKMTIDAGTRVVSLNAEGTEQDTGEKFTYEWGVWEEPERKHSSGLYGEW